MNIKNSAVHRIFVWRASVSVVVFGILTASVIADETSGADWDTRSDTWVATDALGRTLPTSSEVGLPRPDKTVGIFYFLWLGRHGERGPFDISRIMAADPTAMENPANRLWGPMYAPHHWGEPLFGYYVSDDDSVLRKHAQMPLGQKTATTHKWCWLLDFCHRALHGFRPTCIARPVLKGDIKRTTGDLWSGLQNCYSVESPKHSIDDEY